MDSADQSLTQLLQRFSEGDRELANIILLEIHPKLHQIASRQVRRERSPGALTPTELINEVWISNLHKGRWKIENRMHFFAIAAHAMRCVLVDAARKRLAQSRGAGAQILPLDGLPLEPSASSGARPEEILEIDRLMALLEAKDPAITRVLEMQYFCGYTNDEVAAKTGLSPRQVRHLGEKGKEWLYERLKNRRS